MRKDTGSVPEETQMLPTESAAGVTAPVVGGRYKSVGALATLFAIVVCTVVIIFLPIPREIVGILVILLTVLILLTGVPIAFSMLLAGGLGLWKLGGYPVLENTLTENIYSAAASWQLSVIPMFILMGIILWRSGLTKSAYEAARQWIGGLPGGLAAGTNIAGAGLAAASGSTIGISYALGRIAIPEMIRARYQPSLATGVVAMAGTLGQLIPPSIMLVIYAGIAQTPVGPQLLAAVIPGALIAFGYAVLIIVRASISPTLAPRTNLSDVTWGTRFAALARVSPIGIVVIIVVGGLFSGLFTATEAGAFGALAALLCGWLLNGSEARRLGSLFALLKRSLLDAVAATAAIFLLLIAVTVLTRVMAMSRLANILSEFVVGLGLGRVGFLLVLILVFVVLGLFLDPLAMILLTLPVISGPLAILDVDMLWFGIFIVILAEIAFVTPPLGMLTFIVHRLSQHRDVNLGTTITLSDVFKGVSWFVVVSLLILLALIFAPDLALWLPTVSAA